jgi:hypothetical protein
MNVRTTALNAFAVVVDPRPAPAVARRTGGQTMGEANGGAVEEKTVVTTSDGGVSVTLTVKGDTKDPALPAAVGRLFARADRMLSEVAAIRGDTGG